MPFLRKGVHVGDRQSRVRDTKLRIARATRVVLQVEHVEWRRVHLKAEPPCRVRWRAARRAAEAIRPLRHPDRKVAAGTCSF